MRHVRLKTDTSKVLRYGDVAAGGLGSFDTALYEEVNGAPPPGFSLIQSKSAATILVALRELFTSQTVAVRYQFSAAMAQVATALEQDDTELAQYIITQTAVPTELESVKTLMLAEF